MDTDQGINQQEKKLASVIAAAEEKHRGHKYTVHDDELYHYPRLE